MFSGYVNLCKLLYKALITQVIQDMLTTFASSSNNGHVSRSVVKRVLARLGVLPTDAQVRALEARYLDDCGFNYVKLLGEVLP